MKKQKIVFWHDTTSIERLEEDVNYIVGKFNEYGIEIKTVDIRTTDIPPLQVFEDRKYYDILLFDWGGMSFGNSMINHFCKYILEEAKDNPSKIYVMVSTFTASAMKEAKDLIDGEQANVFLSIREAADLIKN